MLLFAVELFVFLRLARQSAIAGYSSTGLLADRVPAIDAVFPPLPAAAAAVCPEIGLQRAWSSSASWWRRRRRLAARPSEASS